jgi:release factor glutamine methyltransferase
LARTELEPVLGDREATAVARVLLAELAGCEPSQLSTKGSDALSEAQEAQLKTWMNLLKQEKPLQYVLEKAWFLGKAFVVTPAVLIPRPETEELVRWVISDIKEINLGKPLEIWDIGTGSGCIAISIKRARPGVKVTAVDISFDALEIARKNAMNFGVEIKFRQSDFLKFEQELSDSCIDILVSNPPYIPASRKELLDRNVRDYEPATALYVPDDDPLLFYKALADFGLKCLNSKGCVYAEMDAAYARTCETLFKGKGYVDVAVKADLSGKLRLLRATKL